MKSLLNKLYKPILAGIVIALVFLSYQYFIGIPKTRAAAYYNLAVESLGLGDKENAQLYFDLAIESFPEAYIVNEYQDFISER